MYINHHPVFGCSLVQVLYAGHAFLGIIFPEIDFDKITKIAGMNISIVTSANTDAEAKALLTKFNMPFRK